jgi:hypothetical protein
VERAEEACVVAGAGEGAVVEGGGAMNKRTRAIFEQHDTDEEWRREEDETTAEEINTNAQHDAEMKALGVKTNPRPKQTQQGKAKGSRRAEDEEDIDLYESDKEDGEEPASAPVYKVYKHKHKNPYISIAHAMHTMHFINTPHIPTGTTNS